MGSWEATFLGVWVRRLLCWLGWHTFNPTWYSARCWYCAAHIINEWEQFGGSVESGRPLVMWPTFRRGRFRGYKCRPAKGAQ